MRVNKFDIWVITVLGDICKPHNWDHRLTIDENIRLSTKTDWKEYIPFIHSFFIIYAVIRFKSLLRG